MSRLPMLLKGVLSKTLAGCAIHPRFDERERIEQAVYACIKYFKFERVSALVEPLAR